MRKSPTVSSMDEDDLLPLSTFAGADFSVQDLARKRLLLSQGEMLKLISDYERAVKIELVSLVNDNYESFIKLSDDVQSIAIRACDLKSRGTCDDNYLDLKQKITTYVSDARSCRAQLDVIDNEKEDMLVITTILNLMMNISPPHSIETPIPIIVKEYNRFSIMVNVLHSALSEKTRSSPILSETMGFFLDKKIEIRADLIRDFSTKLDISIRSSSFDLAQTLISALYVLRGEEEVKSVFGENFFSKKMDINYQNLTDSLKRIENEFFSSDSYFSKICGMHSLRSLVVTETMSVIEKNVNVFIPNESCLNVFRANFLAVEAFSKGDMHKWQTGIYITLRVASHVKNNQLNLSSLEKDMINFEFPNVSKLKFIQSIVLAIDTTRRSILESLTKDSQISVYSRLCEFGDETNRFGERLFNEIIQISAKLFYLSANEILHSIASPVISSLDSVKQLSALYRVSSRQMPTRHSVYIDQCAKQLEELKESVVWEPLKKILMEEYAKICQRVPKDDPRIVAQLKLDLEQFNLVLI